MELNPSELKKYSRQLILKNIGVSGQKKIFNSKILVIGAGGLGCPLMLYLAYSGVGNIGIVDNDKIEISNLSRQVLFTKSDLGKSKVSVSKKFIKKINKKIFVKIYLRRVDKENIHEIAKNYDYICDGTDNFKSRLLINDYCIKYKKILISSAISKYDGHIFSFDFKKDGPCLRCFMPNIPSLEQNCETDGIMSTLAGIAGSIQANEVIKSILNIGKPLRNEIMIFNSLDLSFRKVKLNKNSSCKNHLHVLYK